MLERRQITGGASVESMTSSAPRSWAISAELPDVGHRGRRVGDRLGEDDPGGGPDGRPDRVQVGDVNEVGLDPETGEHVPQQAVGAAVERGGRHHVRPARAKARNTPEIAAIPDANAWAAGQRGRLAPSMAATARANASTVGLSIRL